MARKQKTATPPLNITHAELVARAATWLRSSQRCSVIITEGISLPTGEIPDAIGWRPRGVSVLVECKVTTADFYADRAKFSRQKAEPMGEMRYYMAPQGIIQVSSLPFGWGLLEAKRFGTRLRVSVAQRAEEPKFEWGKLTEPKAKELALLIAELRRVSREPPEFVRCKHCGKSTRRVGLQLSEKP
jgi:hypothetical protein